MDTYDLISSWPISHTKNENTAENNMDSNIKSIHSNFMIFKQVLFYIYMFSLFVYKLQK